MATPLTIEQARALGLPPSPALQTTQARRPVSVEEAKALGLPVKAEPKKPGFFAKVGQIVQKADPNNPLAAVGQLGQAVVQSGAGRLFTGNTQKFADTLGTAASIVTGDAAKIDAAAIAEREADRQKANLLSGNAYTDPTTGNVLPGRQVSPEQAARLRSQIGQGQQTQLAEEALPSMKKTAKQVYGEGLGTLLEASAGGSYGGFAPQAGTAAARSLPQAALRGFVSGGTYGGVGAASKAMQEDKSLGEIGKSVGYGAAVGGTLGALTSVAFQKLLNHFSPEQATKRAADINRKVLGQTKTELGKAQAQELAGRGRDMPTLMAEKGIVLGKTSNGKLDTTEAVKIASSQIDDLDDQLTALLKKNDAPMASLIDIQDDAFKAIDKIKNATALDKNAMKQEVQSLIEAEIRARAPGGTDDIVTAAVANELKRALYKHNNYANPKADEGTKILANIFNERIKEFAKTMNIADDAGRTIETINKEMGDWLVLNTALKAAEGRGIQGGGLLMKGLARIGGGIIGSPLPVVGPMIGYEAGGRVVEKLTDPARRSAQAAALMAGQTFGQRVIQPALQAANPALKIFGRTAARKVGELVGK